jgi:hypothetical protein
MTMISANTNFLALQNLSKYESSNHGFPDLPFSAISFLKSARMAY